MRVEILDKAENDLVEGYHFYEGQQAGLGPLLVAQSVDCTDQSPGTGLEQGEELGIGHGSTVTAG